MQLSLRLFPTINNLYQDGKYEVYFLVIFTVSYDDIRTDRFAKKLYISKQQKHLKETYV